MHVAILAAGKPALSYARDGIDEYLKRLRRYGSYELTLLKAGSSEEVSARLRERSQGCYRIVLDERGERWTTAQLTRHFESLEMRGEIKTAAFLIGASDGHTQTLRDEADLLLSLSPLTMQHELALVVLLEQLYRVATIRRGEPYHR